MYAGAAYIVYGPSQLTQSKQTLLTMKPTLTLQSSVNEATSSTLRGQDTLYIFLLVSGTALYLLLNANSHIMIVEKYQQRHPNNTFVPVYAQTLKNFGTFAKMRNATSGQIELKISSNDCITKNVHSTKLTLMHKTKTGMPSYNATKDRQVTFSTQNNLAADIVQVKYK